MKTVALFTGSLAGGGAERVFVTLANEMARQGLKVDLVLVKAEGPYLSHVDDSVRLVNLSVSRTVFALPALVRYLRRSKPDALLSGLPVPNMIAVLAAALSRGNVKTVISEHSTISQSLGTNPKGSVLLTLMRLIYPHANERVAVSSGAASDLEKELGLARGSVRTIYNPVVSPDLCANASAEVDWPFEGPVILAAGRLDHAKDYPTLLRSFARLLAKRPATLVILGEGPLRTELTELADELGVSQHVIMPGFANNPYAWMRRADLFVMSSSREGFGNVLVEAMACGTPVISTDCPHGPSEILEGGKWGGLVRVGDDAALSEMMEEGLAGKIPPAPDRAAQFSVASSLSKYVDLIQ